MAGAGPPIEQLIRRLAETPDDFLSLPLTGMKGAVNVPAIVSDLLRDLGGEPLSSAEAIKLSSKDSRDASRLSAILVASWLFHDSWFRERQAFAPAVRRFLDRGLDTLASLVKPELLVSDPDRREELARLALAALGLTPEGETETQAIDRLKSFDSAERRKVIASMKKQEDERKAAIRKAMEEARAREAASNPGHE